MKKITLLITTIILAALVASCSGNAFDDYKKTRETRLVPGPVEDLTAPSISGTEAVEADRIRITFSENVDPASAQELSNYHIQGINRIVVKNIEMPDEKTVDLVLWTDREEHRMKSGIQYTLLVQNVADENENVISYRTDNFTGKGWVVATITADVPASTNQESINVTVAGDNIVGYQYSVDNGAWSREYSVVQNISITGLAEGAHELRVVGKHSDGSWQEINYSSKLNWTVDLTPPEARISSAPEAVTEETNIEFTFNGTDVTAYRYLLESDDLVLGGTWSGETPVSEALSLVDLDAGSYIISIIAQDTAGNWQAELDATVYNFRIIEPGQIVVTLSNLPDEKSNDSAASVSIGGVGAYYYTYSIDGSDWSQLYSIATPVELENLSQGSHTLRVRGADFSASIQPEEEAIQYTWNIDSIAPVAVLENLPAVESSDRSIYVSVTGNDIVRYRYRLDGSTWSGYFEVTDPIEINSLGEGSHTLGVSAVDEFGNEQIDQTAATEHTWTIDLTAPEAALGGSPPELANTNIINITVGGTDVVGYKYRIDTGLWSMEHPIADTIALAGLTETSHQLRVIARDAAGNWQAIDAPTTISWTIDATAPAASLSNLPADPTPLRDISIIVGGVGVVAYKYSLDDASPDWSAKSEIDIALPVTNGTQLAETTHNLYVIARDAAGNWQTDADRTIITWTVDTSIPEAVLSNTPDAETSDTTASITVGGDSITNYKYRVDYEASFSSVISVGTPISLTGLSEGEHAVYVVGQKGAQWQTTDNATVYRWTVDNIAPVADLDNKPNDVTNATDVSITVGGIGVVAYKYSLDNASPSWGAMTEIDAATPVSETGLSETTHNIYVIARDAAGNWQADADRTTYTWRVDTASAVAELNNVPGSPTSMASADILVGPLTLEGYKYRFSTDGSAPDDEVWSPVLPIEQHIVLDSLPDSTIILEVIGKDIYGNWQEVVDATTVTWTIDTSLPTAKLTGLPSEQTTSTGLDITVGTEDGSAAVNTYKYKLDEGAWQDGGDADNGINAINHITATGLSDGYHRLYVIGKSESGMWQSISNATSYTWKIDSSAPVASLVSAPANNGDTTDTFVNISVGGDGVVAYKYVLNDASPDWGGIGEQDVSSTISQSGLTPGNSYSLRVIGRDSIGNWQSVPTLLQWNVVFIEAPKVSSSSYENDILVSFSWDNPANTGNVEIQVAGAKADGTADFDNPLYQGVIGNVGSYNYIADTESKGSRYFARVKVQDVSSNWSVNWGEASDGVEVTGSISGLVKDTDNNTIDGATITLRYMSDNSIVLTNEETPQDVTVQTGSDGRFLIENVPVGTNRYRLVCEVDTRNTVKNNVTVVAGENTDIGSMYLVPSGASQGDITGTLVDANTASIIEGATVTVYGWNVGLGDFTVAGSGTTNSSGYYTVSNVPAGTYTVIISNDNYFDLTVDNQVVNGTLPMGRQAICEILSEPQVRVIVLWGNTPDDLDLHLVGPSSQNVSDSDGDSDRFHTYWSGHKSFDEITGGYSGSGDTTGSSSTASLVQDITSGGYGPEAMNLYRHAGVQYARGIYTFTVHNWSGTTWMPAGSAITMRVYDSLGMAREINFPTTGWSASNPRYWKAAKIDVQGIGRSNRKIHVVNQFADLTYGSKESMDW